MSPATILALIVDLYEQLADARARVKELEAELAIRPPTATSRET